MPKCPVGLCWLVCGEQDNLSGLPQVDQSERVIFRQDTILDLDKSSPDPSRLIAAKNQCVTRRWSDKFSPLG